MRPARSPALQPMPPRAFRFLPPLTMTFWGEAQRGRDIGLHATGLAALPANINADVLSVDPAQLLQALA